jgi:hypothetical protein
MTGPRCLEIIVPTSSSQLKAAFKGMHAIKTRKGTAADLATFMAILPVSLFSVIFSSLDKERD